MGEAGEWPPSRLLCRTRAVVRERRAYPPTGECRAVKLIRSVPRAREAGLQSPTAAAASLARRGSDERPGRDGLERLRRGRAQARKAPRGIGRAAGAIGGREDRLATGSTTATTRGDGCEIEGAVHLLQGHTALSGPRPVDSAWREQSTGGERLVVIGSVRATWTGSRTRGWWRIRVHTTTRGTFQLARGGSGRREERTFARSDTSWPRATRSPTHGDMGWR